jgi:hypothetical protein
VSRDAPTDEKVAARRKCAEVILVATRIYDQLPDLAQPEPAQAVSP